MSGGGLVKIRATAKGRILGVDIDDSLLQPSEKAMLEDLIAAAHQRRPRQGGRRRRQEMQKMTSGLPLPPGFKLPF